MISAWARSTFRGFMNPGYRVLWIGSTLAFLAFGMSSVVQGVVAFDLTGKNGAVGAVGLGMGLATLFIAPFGGVLADRLARRKLLLVGQSIIGLSFFGVAALIVTGHITILWLALSTFIMGGVFSFIAPARQAWIGEIVSGPGLPNAIALQQLGMTVTGVFGPFLAGALIAASFMGTGGTYFVMSGLFVVVVATLAKVPGGDVPAAQHGSSLGGDFLLGVNHLRERPRLMLLAVSFIGFVVAGFSYQTLIPGYLENALGRPAGDIGIMYGVSAISGLIVTIGLASISDSRHAFTIMIASGVVVAIGLALTAAAPTFMLAMGAMLLLGAGTSAYQLLNNSLIMQAADPLYYGRVMSLVMLAWGFNSLVALPYGILADHIGERETLVIMSVLVLGVSVIAGIAGLLVSRSESAALLAPDGAPSSKAPSPVQ